MSPRQQWMFGIGGVVLVAILSYFASGWLGIGNFEEEPVEVAERDTREAEDRETAAAERLCGAQATIDSIRGRIFDRAREATAGDPADLTRLERDSLALIEEAGLVRYSEEFEEARCEGRLVIQLPPGTEPAFNNSRRLDASLAYTVEAGGGGGSVYRLSGADMIIDLLASADLRPREPEEELVEEGLDEQPGWDDENDDSDAPTDLLPPAMEPPSPR